MPFVAEGTVCNGVANTTFRARSLVDTRCFNTNTLGIYTQSV